MYIYLSNVGIDFYYTKKLYTVCLNDTEFDTYKSMNIASVGNRR